MRTRYLAVGGLLLVVGVAGTVQLGAQDPSDEART